MISIPQADILYLIAQYLESSGHHRLGRKVMAEIQQHTPGPLCKKNLERIIQGYVCTKSKLIDAYTEQQEEQEEEETNKNHKKLKTEGGDPNYAGTVLQGFTRPKLLETTVVDKLEVVEYEAEQKKEEPKQKKEKKKKRQPSEESEEKPKKHKKEKKEEEKPKASKKPERQPRQPLKCQLNPVSAQDIQPKPQNKQQKRFFSRINAEQLGDIPQELKDNSFHAKFKFGAGDEWGQYGYERLKDTKGDGFKKEKGKLKTKAFQASGIDIYKINSIKL